MTSQPIRGFDCPVDCSHLAAKAKAAGFSYIGRYYSHNPRKNLSPAEAKAISAAGLGILSIWEARGDKYATFSGVNGAAEAKAAVQEARMVGQPPGSAIYFTVDFDASPLQISIGITAYFKAAQMVTKAAGYTIGVYGSGLVCQTLKQEKLVDLTMLACAGGWRGTHGFTGEDIRQHLPTHELGIDLDPEETVRPHESQGDIGAWSLKPHAKEEAIV